MSSQNWFDVERRKIAITNLMDSIKTLYLCMHNQNIDEIKSSRDGNIRGSWLVQHSVTFNPNQYTIPCYGLQESLISFICNEITVYFEKDRFFRIPFIYAKTDKEFKTHLWKELNSHRILDEEIETLVARIQTEIISAL